MVGSEMKIESLKSFRGLTIPLMLRVVIVRRGGGEAVEGVGVTDGLAADDGLAEGMVAGEGCGEGGWTTGMVDWSGGAAGGGTGDWGVPARDCIGCCGHW